MALSIELYQRTISFRIGLIALDRWLCRDEVGALTLKFKLSHHPNTGRNRSWIINQYYWSFEILQSIHYAILCLLFNDTVITYTRFRYMRRLTLISGSTYDQHHEDVSAASRHLAISHWNQYVLLQYTAVCRSSCKMSLPSHDAGTRSEIVRSVH